MKRLTEKDESPCTCCRGIGSCRTDCSYKQIYDRLAEYEDMEEQGLLVRLPCRVGDTLFFVMNGEIYSGVVRALYWKHHKALGVYSEVRANTTPYATLGASFDDFGKTVFLTREEAKKALEDA